MRSETMRAIMAGVAASNAAMSAVGLDQYQIPDSAVGLTGDC